MQVRVYGGGGQTTQIITQLMSLAQGVQYLGEEVPAVGRILDGVGGDGQGSFLPRLAEFTPYIRQALADVNPRMFSSLKIVDLIDRLNPVLAGREDLVTALTNLREDANFRVVGNIPVAPLLSLLGINLPQSDGEGIEQAIPLDEEPPESPTAIQAAIEDAKAVTAEDDLDLSRSSTVTLRSGTCFLPRIAPILIPTLGATYGCLKKRPAVRTTVICQDGTNV
jgi:hypothetical protein